MFCKMAEAKKLSKDFSCRNGEDVFERKSGENDCLVLHPFEIEYHTDNEGYVNNKSVEHSESGQRNPSCNLEVLDDLIGESDQDFVPQVWGKSSRKESLKNIEELLPSRVAAFDGTRMIALRQSRSRSRRSKKSRAKEDVPSEATASQVRDGIEDVTDSTNRQQVEMEMEDIMKDLSSVKLHATTMEKKRRRRRELLRKTSQPTKGSSGFQKWWTGANYAWKKRTQYANNLSRYFEIWDRSMKNIEGSFGASVLSYFVFLRFLFFMNIFISFVIIVTIVIPQILIFSSGFLSVNCHSINSTDFFLMEACKFSELYYAYIDAVKGNSSAGQLVLDFFMGTGWMENSVLFFGFYSNQGPSLEHYNMALSYFLTTGFYLGAILIFMVLYTGQGLKQRMLRFSDQPINAFEQVFCGWDYSLCDSTSAKEKHKSIYKEFNMIYKAWERSQKKQKVTLAQKCHLWAKRMLGHFVVTALLAGAAASVAITMVLGTPVLYEVDYVKQNDFLMLVVSFLPSIVITVLNIILPVMFQYIVLLEEYSDETQLRITLSRTVFLRLASIAVLFITVIAQFNMCSKPCKMAASSVITYCWETYVGQQMYRLVILDFFIILAIVGLCDYPLYLLSRRFPTCWLFGGREFNVPQNVIDLTYTQALCWIGAFFCPLIPVITSLKMLIFFSVKKFTLMRSYQPKPSLASGTTYFFMIILMITFVLCSAAIAYTVGRVPPSMSCGPFRVYAHENFFMFNSLTTAIQSLPIAAQNFFYVIGSWIFCLALAIGSSLLILWRCLKAHAHREMVTFLKERLKIECADKEFLLSRVKVMAAVTEAE